MINNNWDLIDLKIFCQAVQSASFATAAADLGISPAYVTKRIAGLEAALGVILFHRTTRRVLISDAGEAVYGWVRKVLAVANELGDVMSDTMTLPSGPLRISTSLRLGRNHIAPILAELNEAFPALEIWLELMDRRVDMLQEGFDIDIRLGDITEPHLIAHSITQNVRVLCASPTYLTKHEAPKTLADLAGHNCLLYRERQQVFGTWRMNGPNGIETVKVTGQMGSNHSDAVRSWAVQGRGIILLASWDATALLNSGALVRILPAYHQAADVWAVTTARLSSSTKLRLCTEFIISRLRQGTNALDTSIR